MLLNLCRAAFAVLFATIVSIPVQGQTPPPVQVVAENSADALSAFLRGTWMVNATGQQRPRLMVVRSVLKEGDGYKLTVLWNFSDANPANATATAKLENGVVTLDLTTGAGSRVAATSTGDARMDGTFAASGKPLAMSFERVSTSTVWKRLSNDPAPILAAGAAVDAGELEKILYGTWLVTVGLEGRTRQLEIRTIAAAGGKFTAEAVYGWSTGNPVASPTTVSVDNGIVQIDLVTSAGSKISARLTSAERFVGTFTTADGKVSAVRILQTGNEVAEQPGTGNSGGPCSAGTKPKELLLVYVSAENCGPCKRWSETSSSDARSSKRGFLATPEGKAITFRQIDTVNYMNTGMEQNWPQDLRWILTKTHAKSGTPRYVLVADGKVVVNTTSTRKLIDTVMPKIRDLAGLKG